METESASDDAFIERIHHLQYGKLEGRFTPEIIQDICHILGLDIAEAPQVANLLGIALWEFRGSPAYSLVAREITALSNCIEKSLGMMDRLGLSGEGWPIFGNEYQRSVDPLYAAYRLIGETADTKYLAEPVGSLITAINPHTAHLNEDGARSIVPYGAVMIRQTAMLLEWLRDIAADAERIATQKKQMPTGRDKKTTGKQASQPVDCYIRALCRVYRQLTWCEAWYKQEPGGWRVQPDAVAFIGRCLATIGEPRSRVTIEQKIEAYAHEQRTPANPTFWFSDS